MKQKLLHKALQQINILQKNVNLKSRSKLTKHGGKALKKLQNLRVREFDKGCGFAVETNDMDKEEIEEQLGKATKTKIDPTRLLTNKIQKNLCRLRKENKFANITYSELYPSDNIPPRLYGTIKAHDVTKPYPSIPINEAIGKSSCN